MNALERRRDERLVTGRCISGTFLPHCFLKSPQKHRTRIHYVALCNRCFMNCVLDTLLKQSAWNSCCFEVGEPFQSRWYTRYLFWWLLFTAVVSGSYPYSYFITTDDKVRGVFTVFTELLSWHKFPKFLQKILWHFMFDNCTTSKHHGLFDDCLREFVLELRQIFRCWCWLNSRQKFNISKLYPIVLKTPKALKRLELTYGSSSRVFC